MKWAYRSLKEGKDGKKYKKQVRHCFFFFFGLRNNQILWLNLSEFEPDIKYKIESCNLKYLFNLHELSRSQYMILVIIFSLS